MSLLPKATVAVVLPFRDAAPTLGIALESLRAQTWKSWAGILVNDGSSDGSRDVALSICRRDGRFRLIEPGPVGFASALNSGIDIALPTASYIARMDADDISEPLRLEKQLEFLEGRPRCVICGTWFEAFGARSELVRTPESNSAIRARLPFGSPFCHPSVMFRSDALDDLPLYRATAPRMEDYEAWCRLIPRVRAANMPFTLLRYRTHPSPPSVAPARLAQGQGELQTTLLQRLGLRHTPAEAHPG